MRKKWYLIFSVALIASSAVFYYTQISIFQKTDDTFFYMLQDLSFVPIQVLLVTLFLDKLMKKREKQSLLNKLNMVIGVFFNDIGTELIKIFNGLIENIDEINKDLKISTRWKSKDFTASCRNLSMEQQIIRLDSESLTLLNNFLNDKKDGLLNMLANPTLLEHDSFTNLLWAVFHVADELSHRPGFSDLPDTDLEHLRVDILRVYKLIIIEWISYMRHLKADYPYLFSIAIRTNPFNPDAEITVS